MKRPYLRVVPGEEPIVPRVIPDTITSLHKLSRSEPESLLHRLNPLQSQPPLRFEFVALSEGEGEPVEFFYGADAHLDALEQRLRSIYPPTFDVERVDVDVTKRLIRPVEYAREEFAERLEDDRLYFGSVARSGDGRTAVSDGGEAAVMSDESDAEGRQLETEICREEADGDAGLADVDLAPPSAHRDGEPLTALEKPMVTDDGHILARPSVTEVEPYGVQWYGAAERRKDWMTTLTEFTELTDHERRMTDNGSRQSRCPLVPVIEHLVEARYPLAFQVVFQRRSDWSRDARRRTGELLNGTDTLLQKVLGFESPGSRHPSAGSGRSARSAGGNTSSSSPGRHRSPTGGRPSRPKSVDEATRYDLIRANSPKRTFSVNLRLLTLGTDEDEPADVAAQLDPLCSVFDLVDGRFYEIAGRRLRSHGFLPGSGERHARAVLERFTSRSVATGGNRFGITNRSETRPDLILNGNELANFVVNPPASVIPARAVQENGAARTEPDDSSVEEQGSAEATAVSEPTSEGEGTAEMGDGLFSSVPESVVHRDVEINQLSGIFEPLTHGEPPDAVLITGPTGSGKTCSAKYAVEQLRQEHPSIGAVYVNCWEDHSRFQALYRILNEIESTLDIHRQSTPRDILLDRLREYDDGPCIVVLDEVDQLDDKDLLYELLNLPLFSLLLIANKETDLLDGLDERLSSRLRGCERIRFDRYTVEHLVDILRVQAKTELDVRGFDETALEVIADAAEGDARVACTTLRIAGRRQEQSEEDEITRDIVEVALPEARQELLETTVEGLTHHQQALLEVIEEEGRIAPSDLYDTYSNQVDDPKSDRTVRDYLTKLERYNLITAEGSTRNRVYRCLVHRQP